MTPVPPRLSHPQARPTPLTRLPTNIFAHFFAKSRHNRPSFEKNAVPLNANPFVLVLGATKQAQKVILSAEPTNAEQDGKKVNQTYPRSIVNYKDKTMRLMNQNRFRCDAFAFRESQQNLLLIEY